jgi:hypothetical protein
MADFTVDAILKLRNLEDVTKDIEKSNKELQKKLHKTWGYYEETTLKGIKDTVEFRQEKLKELQEPLDAISLIHQVDLETKKHQTKLDNIELEIALEKLKAEQEFHEFQIEQIKNQRKVNKELSIFGEMSTKIRRGWEKFAAENPVEAAIYKWGAGLVSVGGAWAFVKGGIIDNMQALADLQKTTSQFFTDTGGRTPTSVAEEWRLASTQISQANALFETENIQETFRLFAQEGVTGPTETLRGFNKSIQEMAIYSGEAANALVPFIAEMHKTGREISGLDAGLGAINRGFPTMQGEAVQTITRFTRLGAGFDRIAVGASSLSRSLTEVGFSSKTAGDFMLSLLKTSVDKMPSAFQHLFHQIKDGDFSGVTQELDHIKILAQEALEVGDIGTLAQQTGLDEEFLEVLAKSNDGLAAWNKHQEKLQEQQSLARQAAEAQNHVFIQFSKILKTLEAGAAQGFLEFISDLNSRFKDKEFRESVFQIGRDISSVMGTLAQLLPPILTGIQSLFGFFKEDLGLGSSGGLLATIGSLVVGLKSIKFLAGAAMGKLGGLLKMKAAGGAAGGASALDAYFPEAAAGGKKGGLFSKVGNFFRGGKGKAANLGKGALKLGGRFAGPLAALAGAGATGWSLGTMFNESSFGKDLEDSLLYFFGSDEAKRMAGAAKRAKMQKAPTPSKALAPTSTAPTPGEIAAMDQTELLRQTVLQQAEMNKKIDRQNNILQTNGDLKDINRQRGQYGGGPQE